MKKQIYLGLAAAALMLGVGCSKNEETKNSPAQVPAVTNEPVAEKKLFKATSQVEFEYTIPNNKKGYEAEKDIFSLPVSAQSIGKSNVQSITKEYFNDDQGVSLRIEWGCTEDSKVNSDICREVIILTTETVFSVDKKVLNQSQVYVTKNLKDINQTPLKYIDNMLAREINSSEIKHIEGKNVPGKIYSLADSFYKLVNASTSHIEDFGKVEAADLY